LRIAARALVPRPTAVSWASIEIAREAAFAGGPCHGLARFVQLRDRGLARAHECADAVWRGRRCRQRESAASEAASSGEMRALTALTPSSKPRSAIADLPPPAARYRACAGRTRPGARAKIAPRPHILRDAPADSRDATLHFCPTRPYAHWVVEIMNYDVAAL